MNEKQNKRHAELLEVLVLLVDGGLRNAVPSAESRRTASREVAQNVLEFLADKISDEEPPSPSREELRKVITDEVNDNVCYCGCTDKETVARAVHGAVWELLKKYPGSK